MSLANALTLSRIPLAVAVVWAWLHFQPWVSLACMGAILATDLLDGPIARATGRASDRGALLDSGVDWLVIYGFFVAILFLGQRPLSDMRPWPVEPSVWLVVIGGFIILARNIRHWRMTRAVGRAKTLWGKPLGAVQYLWLLGFFSAILPDRPGLIWSPDVPFRFWGLAETTLSWGSALLAVLALLHAWENARALAVVSAPAKTDPP